ncbi:MAG: ATP-binding protein, partial [Microcoleaceae cyanobacterium]
LLSETDTQLQEWKDKILATLGENAQVIIDVIPELESIIGQQPPVAELSGSAAQNRFNLLFSKFIQVFTTPEHPLVLFLDDLQWADSASLNLLKLLMGDTEIGYLLLLGAYRYNEVYPAHPLMLTLDEIENNQVIINTITLEPLTQSGLNHLIADTLTCSIELAFPLTKLVYQKTKGNPFFATQFLKGLYEDGEITFNLNAGYWQCDIIQVRQLSLTSDVVEFMAQQLQKLPEETQQVLKLSAAIGNQFDLQTLAIVSQQSKEDTADNLWKALQESFILPQSEIYKFYLNCNNANKNSEKTENVQYRFLHDRVQQAAYSLIPDEQKETTHYHIGQLLLCQTSQAQIEEKLFDIVNQLNHGIKLIEEPTERQELAELNLKAAQKAKASTANTAAAEYSTLGINLLSTNSWSDSYYLTLALHEIAVEAYYLSGNFEQMEIVASVTLQNTTNLLDQIKIYEIKIQASVAQNQLQNAMEIALSVLELLDIYLPKTPNSSEIEAKLQETALILSGKKIEDLIDLPTMTAPEKLAAMRILSALISVTFVSSPTLMIFVICEMVGLSLGYGNSPSTAFAYATYGLILCGLVQDIDLGYKFGILAQRLLTKFDSEAIQSKVYCIIGFFTTHWKKHFRETLSLLKDGYKTGLESGDFEFGAYSILHACENSYFLGHELHELEAEMQIYSQEFARLKQTNSFTYNEIYRQAVLYLLHGTQDYNKLVGVAYDETQLLPSHQQQNDRYAIHTLYLNKLILTYLLSDPLQALKNAEIAGEYVDGVIGTSIATIFYFYDSLAQLAVLKDGSELEKSAAQVEANQEKLKLWAEKAPMNYQHKYDLVEAERHRVSENYIEAIQQYDRAISLAKKNEYIQEEALANELAAIFYLNWGKEKIAATYMQDAYYCYARWGAKAKTEHLEATYPQLLAGILQQAISPLPLNASISLSSHQTVRTSNSLTTSLLDISAAIKASQTLSGEIELEALLTQLMHIVLENAGADKAGLILNNDGVWEVVAQCIQQDCQLSPTPLYQSQMLPLSIVRKVQRSQKTIIINQVAKDKRFASDNYLMQQQPKSLFCTPILNQGRLIGILYLENNLTTGAFTTQRIEVLNLLCSQAAISIENARLYRKSIDYAKKLEGTVQQLQQTQQQLQNSFEELQNAQLQLVQSEKMSALGNLMAGVAHEINNPVGFIAGNLQPAQDYVQDLLGLIDLYQQKYPEPDEEIEAEIEEMDLEFVREDLPELISSMAAGTNRIAHISNSLRSFSRTDTERQVLFDVHEGLDSTLLILKHRLKANEKRPEIEIVCEYDNKLPEINCFPGQLNQVFMNLIANGIDALDESNSGRSFEEITANPNRITIQTKVTSEGIMIGIGDNGKGMPEEVKNRIFEQGFTTKGVGKGTGLGLAIARQIVAEKHHGSLKVDSQVGKGTEFCISLPIEG